MKLPLLTFCTLLLLVAFQKESKGQNCDPEVPVFNVDLSSNPDTTWLIPDVQRNGTCCDAKKNAPCVLFNITLHPDAVGVNFGVCEGAEPSGALYYQIGCGEKTPVGQPICLNSAGPHELTFCKPGANQNTFCITSIPAPKAGPDVIVQEGCSVGLSSEGFDENFIQWQSVHPGLKGNYDYLLSCNNCPNPQLDLSGVVPDTLIFEVSGLADGECGNDIGEFRDSVRVIVTAGPVVKITAEDKVLCTENDQLTLTATITGGTPPYNMNWNNGATGNTITVGPGSYTVSVTDDLNCETITETYVIAPPNPITVNASITAVNCVGGTDGSATITISGGNPEYQILWDDPATKQTATASNLAAGTYNVTVTDSAGCIGTASVNIPEPANALGVTLQNKVNVSCRGGADGNIFVLASGGTSPYTYQWNHNSDESSNNLFNLTAGTYFVTVADANGCQVSMAIEISEPDFELEVNANSTEVKCFGGTSGSVTLAGAGGTAPYQYRIQGGNYQTGTNFSGLSAGSYSFEIRDANGCLNAITIDVNEPSNPLSGSIVGKNTSCSNSNDGEALASISGGTPPYSFQWNDANAQVGNPATGLAAGNYSLTVKDSNNCVLNLAVQISAPEPLFLSLNSTANLCANGKEGTATVTVTGGTAPYRYLWNDNLNQQGSTATGLAAGDYQVTVTDANNCTAIGNVNVSEPSNPLNASIQTNTPVACFGASTGSANLQITGGQAPYQVNWNDAANQTGTSLTNVASGSYTASITDANGCTLSKTVNISQPNSALELEIIQVIPVYCAGESTGSASVRAFGGTSPYTYSWNDPNFQTGSAATNLSAGTYMVTATDANGCEKELEIIITETPALTLTAGNINPVLCKGGATGSATVNVIGGTAPYTYQWSDSFNQTGPTATNLKQGNYTIVVTDNKGCTKSIQITITEPQQALNASISSINNVRCKGESNGSASVIANGGTPPYQYNWSDENAQQGNTANNLKAGVYQVNITDANGCSKILNVNIGEPQSPLRVGIQAIQNISCFGGSDGIAEVEISGGNPTYNVFWSPSGINGVRAENLAAGLHQATVVDDLGCSVTAEIIIETPANPLSAQITTNQSVSCFGGNNGTLVAEVEGGTLPYSYQWNDTGSQTSNTAVGLTAGSYTVIITDANGCQTSVTDQVNEPAMPLTVSTNSSAAKCNNASNGFATAIVSGGTAPYSYLWNDALQQSTAQASQLGAGSYQVTVTDFNGCVSQATALITEPNSPLSINLNTNPVSCANLSDGLINAMVSGGTAPYSYLWNDANNQTSATATNLSSGEYQVTVTDANFCVGSASISVNEPNEILLDVSYSEIVCAGQNNGVVSVTVSGGRAPYSYFWNDQNGSTSNTASELAPGSYSVIVTDANGCQKSTNVQIDQEILLELSLSVSEPTCFGANDGSIISEINGGQAPYNYTWNPGGQTTRNLIGIGAGDYTLTVRDANLCPVSVSATLNEPNDIAVSTQVTDVNCFGLKNGIIAANSSGGTPPYQYEWNDPENQSGSIASGLAAGNYQLEVTDSKSCKRIVNAIVQQPNDISIQLNPVDNNCFGENLGNINANVGGGTPPYNFSWNDSQNQQTATAINLAKGTYTLTVTDNANCVKNKSASINEPQLPLRATIATENVICKGSNTGNATISVSGGTPGYNYQWNDALAQTTATASNLAAGQYQITITDQNGCSLVRSVIISEPQNSLVLNTSSEAVACKGGSTGTAEALVSGGITPYQYLWNDVEEQTSSKAVGLATGVYNVVVKDAGGCEILGSVFVQEAGNKITGAITPNHVLCFEDKNGVAQLSLSGGQTPFTYLWNDAQNQTQATASNLSPGKYQVVATDNLGCQYVDSITINGPEKAIFSSFEKTPVSCFGGNNGTAKVLSQGGTAPYNYQWNDPLNSTSDAISNLNSGYYLVEVRDQNNCLKTDSVFISEADSIEINFDLNHVVCKGDANGKAKAYVSGGVAPFAFSWNNSPFSATNEIDGLSKGNYNVILRDAKNCEATGLFTISEPLNKMAVEAASKQVLCFGDNTGKAWATISGGNAPLEILWNDDLAQKGDTAFNLGAGRYQVIVSDNLGCIDSSETTVSEPANPLNITPNTTPAKCFNQADGSAAVEVLGGTPPYSYQWNDPNSQSTQVANSLKQGNYFIKVTDNNGCTTVKPVLVNGPESPIQVGINTAAVHCFGGNNGSATVSVKGGSKPYSYQWNVPGGGSDSLIQGLQVGSYSVEIVDRNNCLVQRDFDILGPSQALELSGTASNELCFGERNGSATVNPTGGASPYTYSWNDPNNQKTRKATQLAPGIYQVVVEDELGCQANMEIEVFGANSPLNSNLSSTATSCFGFADGTVNAEAFGGTPPYSFNWNIPGAGTQKLVTGVTAGPYYIDIIDANSCRIKDTVIVNQPQTLRADLEINAISCFGLNNGELNAAATGGSPNYSYTLNQQQFNTTGYFGNLQPGNHTLEIKDRNNCIYERFIYIDEPKPLTISTTKQDVLCFGQQNGGARVKVETGGTLPYQISWDGNAYKDTSIYKASNLGTGNYRYVVKDANNCTQNGIININQPSPLNISVSGPAIICAGSTVNLSVSANGGTGILSPIWNQNLPPLYSQNVAPTRTTLYTVEVRDENNCFSDYKEIEIKVRNSAEEFIRINTIDSICSGSEISVFANHTQTVGPYTYFWKPVNQTDLGPFNYQVDSTVTFEIFVVNACNDTITDQQEVTAASAPKIWLNDTILVGCAPLEILLIDTVNPNSGLLDYQWNLGDGTSSTSNPLRHSYESKGEYNLWLTVTSPYGCESTSSAPHKVLVYPSPFADAEASTYEVDIRNPEVSFYNTSEDYTTWNWNFGDGTSATEMDPIKVFADTGLYQASIVVWNQFACSDEFFLNIKVNPYIKFKVPTGFTPNPNGGNGGSYDKKDLSNDVFYPISEFVSEFNMKIFNRWGELVFESNDINRGWDGYYKGKLSQQDVYIWKITAGFVTGEQINQTGNVTLIWK